MACLDQSCPIKNSHPRRIHPNGVNLCEALYNLTWFAWCRSALLEVKIREIMIHWPCLVLKMWQRTSVDSYETQYDSTRFARSHVSRKLTSGMTNGQRGKWFLSMRSNRVKSTTFSSHPTQATGSQDLGNNDAWTFLVLKTWPQISVDSYDSCWFDWIKSNRQHF